MSAENIAIVKRWVEQGLGGDPSIADELIAPSYVNHDGSATIDVPGPEGQRKGIKAVHEAFTGLKFIIDDIVAEGDRVAVRDHMVGVNTGAFAGRAPTNRPIDIERIVIYRVEGGQIRESWAAMDTFALLRQLGLFDKPAPPKPPATS